MWAKQNTYALAIFYYDSEEDDYQFGELDYILSDVQGDSASSYGLEWDSDIPFISSYTTDYNTYNWSADGLVWKVLKVTIDENPLA